MSLLDLGYLQYSNVGRTCSTCNDLQLSTILICALALGLIFENAYARGFNYCNFFLEHENLEDWSVNEEAINYEGLMKPTARLDAQVYLNADKKTPHWMKGPHEGFFYSGHSRLKKYSSTL